MQKLGVQAGFSLMELMITVAVAALLATIAVPAYDRYVERARVTAAIADVQSLSLMIERFRLNNDDRLPDALGDLGVDIPTDPWGNAYEYLNILTAGPGKGAFRKDGKLNPLNSDFDLYSVGRDGDSKGPLSAKASHDDIVRANNGTYVGLGKDY